MKILLVAEDLRGSSGWGRYTVGLAEALSRRGHAVAALVADAGGASDVSRRGGLPPPLSALRSPVRLVQAAWRIASEVRQTRPDLVHFTVEPYALALGLLPRTLPATVATLHGSYARRPLRAGRWTRPLALRAHARASRLVCVSRFTRNALLSALPPALFQTVADKCVVVTNGVEIPPLAPLSPTRDGAKRILFVGHLKERKGLLEAVEACRVFRDRFQAPFRYDIVGAYDAGDPYVARLREKVSASGLGEQVTLRGRVGDAELRDAYRSADLFLMLSKETEDNFEGFGLVFLEANAWGTPTIGPDTGGCPEAIEHGVSGYVCGPDPVAISERMADVLLRGTIRREDCRRWAEANDLERMVDAVEECYRLAMEGEGPD